MNENTARTAVSPAELHEKLAALAIDRRFADTSRAYGVDDETKKRGEADYARASRAIREITDGLTMSEMLALHEYRMTLPAGER